MEEEVDVYAEYDKLTTEEKNKILWEALDFMNQYNGRRKYDCVGLAMGFKQTSDDDGLTIYVRKATHCPTCHQEVS
jgi:hypothetical protein